MRAGPPDDEMEAVRSLALQDIRGLEDEPRSKVLVELRKRHHPSPLGNDHRGTVEGVTALTIEELRQRHARLFRPRGAILAVAGNFEWAALRDQVERLFGAWQGDAPSPPPIGARGEKLAHIAKDLAQTQIAAAYSTITRRDLRPGGVGEHATSRRPALLVRRRVRPAHRTCRRPRPSCCVTSRRRYLLMASPMANAV